MSIWPQTKKCQNLIRRGGGGVAFVIFVVDADAVVVVVVNDFVAIQKLAVEFGRNRVNNS